MSIAGREVYVIDVDERGTPKVKRLSDAAELLGDDMRRAADGIERMESSMRRGTGAVKAGRLSLLELNSGLEIASKGARALGGIFSALKAPTKLAASFETEIAAIDTITKQAGTRFRDQFLDISERTGQDAAEVARAAYEAISAGVAQESAAQFVEVSNELARSGRAGLTESLELLATIREQFSLTDDELNRVNSQIFLATRDGRTKVSELAADLGGLIPLAKSAGQSLEEMLGGIVSITKAGITTNTATVQLKAYAVAVQKNGGNIAKALTKTGNAITETEFKSLSLAKQVTLLNTAFSGNEGALIKLFGRIDGVQAVQVLARNGAVDLENAVGASAAAANEASAAVGRFASTAEAAFGRTKATFNRQLIELGQKLLPLVTEGLADLTEFLKTDGAAAFDRVATAATTLGRALLTVVEGASAAFGVVERLGTAIGNTAGAVYVAAEDGVSRVRAEIEASIQPLRDVEAATARTFDAISRATNGASETFQEMQRVYSDATGAAIAAVRVDELFNSVQGAETQTRSLELSVLAMSSALGGVAPAAGIAGGAVAGLGESAGSAYSQILQLGRGLAITVAQMSSVPGAAAAAAAAFDVIAAQGPRSGGGGAIVVPEDDDDGKPKGRRPLVEDQVEDYAKIREQIARAAEAIQDRANRNRLGAIEDQTTRELALLDLRFAEELRTAERAGDDIGAVKARQAREFGDSVAEIGQRQAQERLSIEQERARLAAQFEQDEFAQRRLNLEIEAEETLRRVSEVGGSVIDATAAFERRRTEIVREQSEARIRALQAEVNNAGELAGSLISLGDAITGSDRRQSAARVALQGAVLAAQATSAGAESLIEFARGNVIKGAALAAAAAAAGIDAIRLGAQAAGLGGSGAPSAGSGAQSRGSGSVERAPVQAPQRADNRPIVINAGLVVGERGVDEFGRLLASSVGRHRAGRNGYIGEEAS